MKTKIKLATLTLALFCMLTATSCDWFTGGGDDEQYGFFDENGKLVDGNAEVFFNDEKLATLKDMQAWSGLYTSAKLNNKSAMYGVAFSKSSKVQQWKGLKRGDIIYKADLQFDFERLPSYSYFEGEYRKPSFWTINDSTEKNFSTTSITISVINKPSYNPSNPYDDIDGLYIFNEINPTITDVSGNSYQLRGLLTGIKIYDFKCSVKEVK